MSVQLWSYWEGDVPPVVSLCLETVAAHNRFTLVTPETVRSSPGHPAVGSGESILDWTKDLKPPQRSDLIRLWWLYQHGGVWVDSDTLCVAPLDWLDPLPILIGVGNAYQQGFGASGLLATPFGAAPRSPVVLRAYETCREMLTALMRGERVPYGATSVGLLSQVYKERPELVEKRQHWRYNRVPWFRAREIFLDRGAFQKHRTSPFVSTETQLYHLTNPITGHYGKSTRDEILHGRVQSTFVEYLFHRALSVPPAVFGRSAEILDRLAGRPAPVAVEVGVMHAMNARFLLHQRRDLGLYLVDPWAVATPNYRKTKDYQAHFDENRWEIVYKKAMRNIEFAKERTKVMRLPSIEAAKELGECRFDLVFIDGNHSYEAVRQDIRAWAPLLKPGGWIGGHDYAHPREGKLYGVKRAVDEWAKKLGLPVETGLDNTWFVRRPE